MNTSGDACVNFWYNMNGQHLARGRLSLFVMSGDSFRNSQVQFFFTTSGDKGESWFEAEVDVSLPNADSRVWNDTGHICLK
jgi:hypothetical protein